MIKLKKLLTEDVAEIKKRTSLLNKAMKEIEKKYKILSNWEINAYYHKPWKQAGVTGQELLPDDTAVKPTALKEIEKYIKSIQKKYKIDSFEVTNYKSDETLAVHLKAKGLEK